MDPELRLAERLKPVLGKGRGGRGEGLLTRRGETRAGEDGWKGWNWVGVEVGGWFRT